MIDKELEAIYKCHESLQNLDNGSRMRVFKYLLDRYGIVGRNNEQFSMINSDNIETVIPEIISQRENKEDRPIKANNNIKKSKSSANQNYGLISSLNLISKGSLSLKDFFGQFVTKNNFENNIVILSYLKNEMKEENVGVNHIYTCYKNLGIKVPSIKQSLFDTKHRKGWIDTSNIEDLKITVAGENFMDHEIVRK
ncbi:hypothetical protein HNP24_000779 [Chryseobacterium sediminis]|uniref:Uncharacterized protein n=1 Tax=Chryseobacterium sediminis TaxID=1679494 RepID=A0ABR6PW71_9FLAO|nr:hypothetical protein [Chryseobacterium sediminis]MBB6329829.1 hypothetical protein [Chryseobacterium sediminis]